MRLIKTVSIVVSGYGGEEQENGYRLSISPQKPKNEKQIEINEVREADVPYMIYDKYVDLGEINESEIEVLNKFKILE